MECIASWRLYVGDYLGYAHRCQAGLATDGLHGDALLVGVNDVRVTENVGRRLAAVDAGEVGLENLLDAFGGDGLRLSRGEEVRSCVLLEGLCEIC